MAGQLDSLFKNVAKSVVATLGDSFDHSITFIKKGVQQYMVLYKYGVKQVIRH